MYDLDQWRASDPSYSDQLFEWTQMNSEDQLYSLGSQPPFNLVVSVCRVCGGQYQADESIPSTVLVRMKQLDGELEPLLI